MSTLTLNLDERHMAALEALAVKHSMSKTAVLRQALRLYQLVDDRIHQGHELAFTKGGKVVPMVLLPMVNPAVPAGVPGMSKGVPE